MAMLLMLPLQRSMSAALLLMLAGSPEFQLDVSPAYLLWLGALKFPGTRKLESI